MRVGQPLNMGKKIAMVQAGASVNKKYRRPTSYGLRIKCGASHRQASFRERRCLLYAATGNDQYNPYKGNHESGRGAQSDCTPYHMSVTLLGTENTQGYFMYHWPKIDLASAIPSATRLIVSETSTICSDASSQSRCSIASRMPGNVFTPYPV